MNQPISERVRWTTADLELFPDNGNRYEIIDGELFVTKAPHLTGIIKKLVSELLFHWISGHKLLV
jgi:hypothetical protein